MLAPIVLVRVSCPLPVPIKFLVKNKLTSSDIKDRLISFIERTIQGAKDSGISKLNRATDALGRIYKDKKASESVDLNDIRYDYGVKPVSEGGNAFDIAMTDAEDVISTCSDQEECLKDLEALIVDNDKFLSVSNFSKKSTIKSF